MSIVNLFIHLVFKRLAKISARKPCCQKQRTVETSAYFLCCGFRSRLVTPWTRARLETPESSWDSELVYCTVLVCKNNMLRHFLHYWRNFLSWFHTSISVYISSHKVRSALFAVDLCFWSDRSADCWMNTNHERSSVAKLLRVFPTRMKSRKSTFATWGTLPTTQVILIIWLVSWIPRRINSDHGVVEALRMVMSASLTRC